MLGSAYATVYQDFREAFDKEPQGCQTAAAEWNGLGEGIESASTEWLEFTVIPQELQEGAAYSWKAGG